MIVLVAAFVLRLAHLAQTKHDILFEHPALDEDRYVAEARLFAHGKPYEQRPFWQPPGIIYALGVIFRMAGDTLTAPRFVQALIGTMICWLIFAIGQRLFDTRTGIAAAAVVALHGLMIFAGGELLPATWACAFDLLALLLLLDARESARHAAGAGLSLGVSALFTPIVLPFAAIAALLLFRRDNPKMTAAFVAGVALPIAPIAYRNYEKSHELVLVSTNGGLNFFIGNNPEYFETVAVRPGPHWPELVEMPRRAANITSPTKSSAWFRDRALDFWRQHPLQALGLYLRKLWLFFHGAEIVRDTDIYDVRRESPVLALLVGPRRFWFPDGIVIPLALAGIVTTIRDRKHLMWPMLFVATQAAFIALFIVSARYRVPVTPVLALFAVVGAIGIARSARRPAAIVATLLVAVVLALPAREVTMAFPGEREFFRGLAYRSMGRSFDATAAFRRAAQADPGDARPLNELAVSLDAMGRPLEAADAWERAAAADPTDLRPLRLASTARMRGGDRAGAIRLLNGLIAGRIDPRLAADYVQLAAMHADGGDATATMRELRHAVECDRGLVRARAAEFMRAFRGKVGDDAFWVEFSDLTR
jgi:4-amino-4-deoxy-L-arabinose transferase-like glycosyltransferase